KGGDESSPYQRHARTGAIHRAPSPTCSSDRQCVPPLQRAPSRRRGEGAGGEVLSYRGKSAAIGSRFFGSGWRAPTPCFSTSRTTASLNGVGTPSRLPSATT